MNTDYINESKDILNQQIVDYIKSQLKTCTIDELINKKEYIITEIEKLKEQIKLKSSLIDVIDKKIKDKKSKRIEEATKFLEENGFSVVLKNSTQIKNKKKLTNNKGKTK